MFGELIYTYGAGIGALTTAIGGVTVWYLGIQRYRAERAKDEAEAKNKSLELELDKHRLDLDERKQDFEELVEARAAYKDLNEVLRRNFNADIKRMQEKIERHALKYETKIERLVLSEENCKKELGEIKKKLNIP